MSREEHAELFAEATTAAPPVLTATRPFYWSLRRELWENRSISLGPLVITLLVMVASLIHLLGLPERLGSTPTPEAQQGLLARPFSLAPAPIMLTAFLIGFFYCLDALYGERRDRSILFWKSLPVSDRITVLAKASIPLFVLPLYAFLLSVATVTLLLLASLVILSSSAVGVAPLFAELAFFERILVMFYGLAVHTLWFAPIYCWLLLVSAWARRPPLLWVVLPPVVILVVERIALGSSLFLALLKYRISGAMSLAFDPAPKPSVHGVVERAWQLEPLRFLSSPGLWIGLVFAAVCLVLAARLRRSRERL